MRGTVTGFSEREGRTLPDVLGDDGVLYRSCRPAHLLKLELGDRVNFEEWDEYPFIRYKLNPPEQD